MILRAACNSCYSRFDVTISPGQGGLIAGLAGEDGMARCPRECGGRVNLTNDPGIDSLASLLKAPIHLTAEEFYQVVNGMGLPDEVPNSLELVESLLRSNSVTGVKLEQVNDRIYLHELHLGNGATIHLTAGGRGAQVLKVTRKP